MIRVAQIIGKTAMGGVEAIIMNLYKNIDRSKVQFDFFVENESMIINKKLIESLGGKVIIIPKYTKPFTFVRTLKRLFQEGQYDIVHSNLNALSVFSLMAAKKAGIKVRIAHSHSTSNKKEWKKNLVKNILRPFSKVYATHLFACSELAGKWLFGKKSLTEGNVTIINNAINLEKFQYNEQERNEIRKEYNLENKFVIGHVGRFMQQKNHQFLISVFKELIKQRNDCVLFLVGEGKLEKKIRAHVAGLGLSEKVVFAGVRSDVEKFYSAFDCFVLPSLYEGLGIVLVEAQTSGLNCLASNFVPKEVDFSGKVKFLDLNYSVWVKEILDLSNKSNDERKSLDCRKFDIKEEARKLLDIYKSMVVH